MNKLLGKVATGIATASLLASAFTPLAFANVTVQISGNGADSSNTANVAVENTTAVEQNNSATINNNVSVSSNSGGNAANNNTGGDVSIDTGNASSNTSVSNTANSNVAEVSGCCPKDITAKISGNGFNSTNEIYLESKSETFVEQNNWAKVKNYVEVNADTGNNEANNNTGGDVSIGTGNAKGDVSVSNKVNKNVAQVGGGDGSGQVHVEISGNGADSTNTANLALENLVAVEQNNWASIYNDVEVNANTGNNEANNNTGGNVEIDTGNAKADVEVENLANFNWADVDACGCFFDVFVKIKDNGFNSTNEAYLYLESALFVLQNNEFTCKKKNLGAGWHEKKPCNNVEVNVDTGNNESNNNTQAGEPEIDTGNAEADVSVETTVNSNVVGALDLDFDFPDLDLPDLPDGLSGLLLLLIGLFS